MTTIYSKPTNTGLYTLWSSFTPKLYKSNLFICLIQRSYKICTNWASFISEIESLQNSFVKIGYPRNFVLNISKNFIDKIFSDKFKIEGPEQKYLFEKLPYIGKYLARIKRDLKKILKDYRPYTKLRLISYPSIKLDIYLKSAWTNTIPLHF